MLSLMLEYYISVEMFTWVQAELWSY